MAGEPFGRQPVSRGASVCSLPHPCPAASPSVLPLPCCPQHTSGAPPPPHPLPPCSSTPPPPPSARSCAPATTGCASTTATRCACWAPWASPSTPRPGAGTTRLWATVSRESLIYFRAGAGRSSCLQEPRCCAPLLPHVCAQSQPGRQGVCSSRCISHQSPSIPTNNPRARPPTARRRVPHCGHLVADRDWRAHDCEPACGLAREAGVGDAALLWRQARGGGRQGQRAGGGVRGHALHQAGAWALHWRGWRGRGEGWEDGAGPACAPELRTLRSHAARTACAPSACSAASCAAAS